MRKWVWSLVEPRKASAEQRWLHWALILLGAALIQQGLHEGFPIYVIGLACIGYAVFLSSRCGLTVTSVRWAVFWVSLFLLYTWLDRSFGMWWQRVIFLVLFVAAETLLLWLLPRRYPLWGRR